MAMMFTHQAGFLKLKMCLQPRLNRLYTNPVRAEATSPRSRMAQIALRSPSLPNPLLFAQQRKDTQQQQIASSSSSDNLSVNPLGLIALTAAVSFICSIDRAAMSVAILPMSSTFDWSDDAKGAISAAFFAGYMITNLCGGYLATRFSAKGVLAFGVLFWSLFTCATPAAASSTNMAELLAVRGLMGVGEGVSYPSVQNIVRQNVGEHARTRALSFIYSGHQLGTVASYVTAPILIQELGWQSVFYIFGSLGFLWLLGWTPMMAKEKSDAAKALEESKTNVSKFTSMLKAALPSSSKTNEEKESNSTLKIRDVPWMDFARSKAFWAIVAAQVTVGIGSCLSFSWLPTYYSQVYGVDVAHSAAFCLIPFITTVLATNAAGTIADHMINNGVLTKTQTRKLMQMVASLGPAVCLLRLASQHDGAATGASTVTDAVVMVTAWLALGGFSAAGYGSNHQDISSKWAGTLFGLSNGLASIAGSASIFATGMVLNQTHDWSLIFTAAAVMYIVGAGVYMTWASAEEQFE